MKYVIPVGLLLYSFLMLSGFMYAAYSAVVFNVAWAGVAAGFFLTTVVGMLATSAAFDAVKDW